MKYKPGSLSRQGFSVWLRGLTCEYPPCSSSLVSLTRFRAVSFLLIPDPLLLPLLPETCTLCAFQLCGWWGLTLWFLGQHHSSWCGMAHPQLVAEREWLKELGPGARTGQTQVSYGNIFSCDVTLVSTCNKKYLLPPDMLFPLFFHSFFPQLQSLSLYSLTETAVLKRHGNLLFSSVPDLDRFGKNLILSHFLIHQVFKIMTPDLIIVFLNYWGFCQFASTMITVDKVPGKVEDGATHLLVLGPAGAPSAREQKEPLHWRGWWGWTPIKSNCCTQELWAENFISKLLT